MASSELIEALQALAHERKIDEFYLIERLEASLAKSYQHILDLEWDARVTIDRQTGHIYVYELVPVGEPDEETGEYSEFEERDVTPDDVSRIAAQNAKGVIASIVREAGRQSIYEEFSDRVGDLVTGTVLQGTPDFTIIKIRDGVEAELPHYDVKRNPNERNERPSNEHYRHNQRLKVLIIEVRDPNSDAPKMRGEQARPAIVVSRTHPDLIRRLFEIEVPEIYDGMVEIKSIAREPGARSKIAVASREANLDPVGACVGPKGSRVRMVVEELRNERVDVIQWHEDPASYVANALSPAKVTNVIIEAFLVVMLFSDSTYQFFYALSAGMILLPYLLSAAYFAKLTFTEPQAFKGKVGGSLVLWRIFGVFGVVYSFFLAWASGATGLTLMSLLYAPGILMYIKGKKERNEPYLKSTVDKVVVAIILIAAVTSLVLLFTGQVVL